MTHDALVYRCDDTSCYFNHGQVCVSAQIMVDEKHECHAYIERGLAESAVLEHTKAEIK